MNDMVGIHPRQVLVNPRQTEPKEEAGRALQDSVE